MSTPMSGDVERSLKGDYGDVHFLGEDADSRPSSHFLTAGSITSQGDSLLALDRGRHRMTPPAYVPYSEYDGTMRHGRPGWVNERPRRDQTALRRSPFKLICHIYFKIGHTAPDCILTVREIHRIVANYEALTDEEREMVPATSYWRAKQQYAGNDCDKPAYNYGKARVIARDERPHVEHSRSPSPLTRPPTPGPKN